MRSRRPRLLTDAGRSPINEHTNTPSKRDGRPRTRASVPPTPRRPHQAHAQAPRRLGTVGDQLLRLASRLTDRDREILRLVHHHRCFTTHQLTGIFFDSHDRAEHRLRQLAQERALDRFRPRLGLGEGTAPYHYVLGPAGAAVLAAEQGIELRRLDPPYRRDQPLQIAQGAALMAWWPERKCHDHWGHVVRPDGYGRWREDSREIDFFIEYDRATEPLDRLAGKLYDYHELAIVSKIATPVLFWLPTPAREAAARPALQAGARWHEVRFMVATACAALGRGPAENAWLPLGQTHPRRRLIELGDAIG